MAPSARQALGAWRNEACVIPITVPNLDLTGKTVRAQLRASGDNPVLTLDLPQTVDPAATGIRFVSVTIDPVTNLPTTHLAWQVTKAAMQGLPYAGEIGDAWVGAYALQIDGHTRLVGPFAALASPIDSDAAPANRSLSYGGAGQVGSATAGVVLTIGDSGVTVTIDGSDLIAPLVRAATQAAASASVSAAFAGAANASAQDAKAQALGVASAIAIAIKGLPSGTTLPIPCGSRLILAAVANPGGTAYLYETGRDGFFVWKAADMSALVSIDPQQGVCVPPSSDATGKSGAWVRSRTSPGYSIAWFGAIGDGHNDANGKRVGFDNTTAIQAAYNFVGAIKGGAIIVPVGVFLVMGPDQPDPLMPAQIFHPRIASVADAITITLRGEVAPDNQLRDTGSIIESTLTTGTGALIGGSSGGQHGCTWITSIVENVGLRLPQNTGRMALDHGYVQASTKRNLRVDVPNAIVNSGGFATLSIAEPTQSTNIAIRGPINDIPLWDIWENVQVAGHYFGAAPGELHSVTTITGNGCKWPVLLRGNRHPGKIDSLIFTSCQNGVFVDGAVETYIGLIDIERTPAAQSGLGWTANYGFDVYDPQGLLKNGEKKTAIHIHDLDANGNQIMAVVGSAAGATAHNFNWFQVPITNTGDAFYPIFPGFGTKVSRRGLRQIIADPGKIAWDSAVANQTDVNAPIRAISGENAQAYTQLGRQDYRIAQITYCLDGALDAGRIVVSTWKGGVGTDHWQWRADGQFQKLSPWIVADTDAAAGAAGAVAGALYKDSNGFVRAKA